MKLAADGTGVRWALELVFFFPAAGHASGLYRGTEEAGHEN
jgi:hypothetical protein